MRRFKRLFRNVKFKRIFLIVIALVIIALGSVGYAYYNSRMIVKGKVVKRFVKDFSVSYNYTLYSTNPYNLDVEVVITNNSTYSTVDWEIYVDLPIDANVRGYYGAELLGNEGTRYHFSSVTSETAQIAPTMSKSFHIQFSSSTSYELTNAVVYGTSSTGHSMGGFTGEGDNNVIDDPTVITDPCEGVFVHDNNPRYEENGNLTASYTSNNSWQSGQYRTYIVKATISNSGASNSNWVMMFKVNNTTSPNCYNGICTVTDDVLLVIPPSWSSVVYSNGSVDFEFQITINDISNLDLIYVGKNVDGYVVSCQPENRP